MPKPLVRKKHARIIQMVGGKWLESIFGLCSCHDSLEGNEACGRLVAFNKIV